MIADDLDERRCVFLAGLYRAEREIAEKLRALTAGKPPWPAIDVDKAIPPGSSRGRSCRWPKARQRPSVSPSPRKCW